MSVTPKRQVIKKGYNSVMNDARGELSSGEALFSRIMHSPVIWQIHRLLITFLLRPRALLVGSAAAIVTLTASFMVARLHGYETAGSEPLVGFMVGWAIGLLYDLCLVSIKSRRR